MDVPRRVATWNNVVCLGCFSEQPLVASLMVCDWFGRRLDRIPRFTAESHRCAHDLLATTATGGGSSNHIFCDLLLSRQCRRILKPRVAIECRTSYPGLC